jgi:hypothetical protein
MGSLLSKINTDDNYKLYPDDIINVNFIQLQISSNSVVNPDQLNVLLGLNIPKYSLLEGTKYPYLFCIGFVENFEKIIKDYGYEIGFSTKQKVYRAEFNNSHRATCSYHGDQYYKLVLITK